MIRKGHVGNLTSESAEVPTSMAAPAKGPFSMPATAEGSSCIPVPAIDPSCRNLTQCRITRGMKGISIFGLE